MKTKSNKALIGSGIITAIAASLCCITPVLALIAGTSGIASTFSWLEPFRPYLIGFTILILGFAWYRKLKQIRRTTEEIQCDCEEDEKTSFWQSKKFLGIVTVFAVLMLVFPLYADVFYSKQDKQVIMIDKAATHTVEFTLSGMTCNGCAEHVKYEVNKLDGILDISASFEQENALIEFDQYKTSINEIEEVINSTGYKVTDKKESLK
jgi:copper chaperone CopZ